MRLKSANINNSVINIQNGRDAQRYIEQNIARPPQLILLDINMPGVDGIEVLHLIKSDSKYKHLPVVMMTSSKHEDDIEKCYEKGANGYIKKPIEFNKMIECVKTFSNFWLELNIVPKSTPDYVDTSQITSIKNKSVKILVVDDNFTDRTSSLVKILDQERVDVLYYVTKS